MFTQQNETITSDSLGDDVRENSSVPISTLMTDQVQAVVTFDLERSQQLYDAKIAEKLQLYDAKIAEKLQWKKENEYQEIFEKITSLKKVWVQRKKDFSTQKKQFVNIIKLESPHYSLGTLIKEIDKLTPKEKDTIQPWSPVGLKSHENELNTLIGHLKETKSTLKKDLREGVAAAQGNVEVKQKVNDINEKTKQANLLIIEAIQQAAEKYKEHCKKGNTWNPGKYPEFLDKFGSVVYVMYDGELDLSKGFGSTYQSKFLEKKLKKEPKVSKEIQVDDILKYPLSSLVGIFNKIFETCKLYGSKSSAADILHEQITSSLLSSDGYLVYEGAARQLKLTKHALSPSAQVKDADLKASEKTKKFDINLIDSTNKKLEGIKHLAKDTLTLTDRDTSAMRNAKGAHDLLVKNATEQYSKIAIAAAELKNQLDTAEQALSEINPGFKELDTGYKKYLENADNLEVKLDSVDNLCKLTGKTIDALKRAQHMLHGQAEEKLSSAKILIEAQSKSLLEAKKLFHAKVHSDHKRVFDAAQEKYSSQLASEQIAIDQVKQIRVFDYELTHYGNIAADCSEIKNKNQEIQSACADASKACEVVRLNYYNLLENSRIRRFQTVLDCCENIENNLKTAKDRLDAAIKECKVTEIAIEALNKRIAKEEEIISQMQTKIASQQELSEEEKKLEKSVLQNCHLRYVEMINKTVFLSTKAVEKKNQVAQSLIAAKQLIGDIQTYKKIAEQSLIVAEQLKVSAIVAEQLKISAGKIDVYEKKCQEIARNIPPTDAEIYEEASSAEKEARKVINDLSDVADKFWQEEKSVNDIDVSLSESKKTGSFAVPSPEVSAARIFLLGEKQKILKKIDQIKAFEVYKENKESKETKEIIGPLVQASRAPQMILDNFENRQRADAEKVSLIKRVIEINATLLHRKLSGIGRGKKVKNVRISTGLADIYNDNHTASSAVRLIVAEAKKRVNLNDSKSSEKKYRYTLFGVRDDVVVDPFYKVLAELDKLSADELKTKLLAINGLVFPTEDIKLSDGLEL